MKILITGIGGPTPRSIARHLRKKYPDSNLIGVDSNPKALGFYMKGLLIRRIVVTRDDHLDYLPVMEKIVNEEGVDLAFIQPEKEVMAWGDYYKEKGNYICPTLIPPVEYTKNLMDKAAMADLLADTDYIPKTVRISPENPGYMRIAEDIGYPCWIRASVGSGGLGSLKLNRREDLDAWLFIHKEIKEFTVSEFLTGRHLANQMLYIEGKCTKNAGLECVEYVMADIAPSKVTGNTSYGKLINEEALLEFCEEVMDYISEKIGVQPHGVFSFDLKEDGEGRLKVTEINIRHMAYSGLMAKAGFDLIGDTVKYLTGKQSEICKGRFHYVSDFIFLRDVDIEPILMNGKDLLKAWNVM
jgi:biotin carboxylase